MTIDEAIKNREDCLKYLEGIGPKASQDCIAAVRWSIKALKALRPVSREQVKEMRGEWIIPSGTDENTKFCAQCGAPMTDKAVEMVMERLPA